MPNTIADMFYNVLLYTQCTHFYVETIFIS